VADTARSAAPTPMRLARRMAAAPAVAAARSEHVVRTLLLAYCHRPRPTGLRIASLAPRTCVAAVFCAWLCLDAVLAHLQLQINITAADYNLTAAPAIAIQSSARMAGATLSAQVGTKTDHSDR
jgi:hypothetical protein